MIIFVNQIIELKSKVTASKWSEVLGQFRGATLRALAFCSTIGITNVTNIRFCISCVDRSRIDEEKVVHEQQKKIQGIVSKKLMLGRRLTDIA